VKVEQVGEGGKLKGHLVNKTDGDLVYIGLVRGNYYNYATVEYLNNVS